MSQALRAFRDGLTFDVRNVLTGKLKDAHRPWDVFDRVLATILELIRQLVPYLIAYRARDAHAPRLAQRL